MFHSFLRSWGYVFKLCLKCTSFCFAPQFMALLQPTHSDGFMKVTPRHTLGRKGSRNDE